jgi:hypothetical protein
MLLAQTGYGTRLLWALDQFEPCFRPLRSDVLVEEIDGLTVNRSELGLLSKTCG